MTPLMWIVVGGGSTALLGLGAMGYGNGLPYPKWVRPVNMGLTTIVVGVIVMIVALVIQGLSGV